MQPLIAGAVLVLTASAVLAAASVYCLAKWDGRRYRILVRPRAAQLAAVPIPQTASEAARGPRTTVTRMWLCQACYWTWPAADLFCGVCGRSRAAASDGREIQSLREGR
jgi:hypothetical protein